MRDIFQVKAYFMLLLILKSVIWVAKDLFPTFAMCILINLVSIVDLKWLLL